MTLPGVMPKYLLPFKVLFRSVSTALSKTASVFVRKAARTGKWGDANTMAYERSQHGHAKFGGSVYGPRLVDTMDEFARASVKSGVNPRRINRLVAQHQHKHANSAKSSSNKKKSNRN